jgi:pyrroline-5-carboxylate reductase
MKISFIGGGNMGEAMLSALLDRGQVAKSDVTVSDVSADRLKYLKNKYGVAVTEDNAAAIAAGEVVVLAIKPQTLAGVMAGLKGKFRPEQLVLSIIAGATIKTISSGLDHGRIVRVMPNTPAQIGLGMSVWTATAGVTGEQKELAGSILGSIGKEIFVEDEKYLDMATAVSGSGPAYFFLFVEALVEAAEEIGFSPETAREMVLQTMLGSGRLIEKTGKSPAELRVMVTSPGGTTAEALGEFDKGDLRGLVRRAVQAALDRARVLGRG